jgi:hypothetical protein
MSHSRILITLKQDPNAFLEFYAYAKKHMVLESLHFLLEVYEYRSLPPFLRPAKEEAIVKKYIVATSKQSVNIVFRIREDVVNRYAVYSQNRS